MPNNNYYKVVYLRKAVHVVPFNDKDGFSAHIAYNRANALRQEIEDTIPLRDKAKVTGPRIILWRIPDKAQDEPLYKHLDTTTPCPSWAHHWVKAGPRGGLACSRCGIYDATGDEQKLQELAKLTGKALDEVPDS